MKYLKKLDYFQQYFTLSFGNKEAYSSKFGGILTIITIIIFISYAIYLGQELVFLQNPFDNMTIKVDKLPIKKQFNIPTAFLIETSDGSIFSENINQYLNIQSVYHNASNSGGTFKDNNNFTLPMRFCNSNDFSSEINTSYYDMSLDDAKCFDHHNLTLGGDFSGDYAMYLDISIKACNNKTASMPLKHSNNHTHSAIHCASQQDIMKFLNRDDLILAIHYESITYESSDFNKPIKKFMEQDDFIIDSGVCKSLYYYVQLFEIYSEKGILISQNVEETHSYFDSPKLDFHLNDKLNSEDLCLFNIIIMSSKNTRIQKRSYTQLSNVIAEVGGALNAYLIFFNVIFRIVYKRKMTEKLLRGLYKDHEPKGESSKSNEFKNIMNFFKTSKMTTSQKKETLKDRKSLEYEDKGRDRKMESMDILNLNIDRAKFPLSKNQGLNISDNILIAPTQPKDPQQNNNVFKKQNNLNESQNKLTPNFSIFKKEIKGENQKFKILNLKKSLISHLMMEICPCLLTHNLKVARKNLERIGKFSISYFDALSVVRKLHEIEKLKFVLFNKKQISLFNSISQPTNPFESNATERNLITEKLKFDKNHNEQKKYIDYVLNKPEDFLNDRISLRLMRYYLNLKENKKE